MVDLNNVFDAWVTGTLIAVLIAAGIFDYYKYVVNKRPKREQQIIDKCGCVCFCPNCKDPLNDQAECTDTDLVRYKCTKCGHKSTWSFDIAPVPICLDEFMKNKELKKEN